jgi:hypothetical protein
MTVVSYFCLFISLVLITPYCFGSIPNCENGLKKQENCTGDLNYPITFENWDEFIHQNPVKSCISENITKTPKTPIIVNLSLELDRILNVDQIRNVIESSLLSNLRQKYVVKIFN